MVKVIEDLDTSYSPKGTCAITVGSFDGVHLGHQALLKKMRKRIGPDGTLVVITFSNHPSHILSHLAPVPLITSRNLKVRYLGEFGADVVYCVPFSEEIAQMTYREFLKKLHQNCPFSLLVLGEGATLGRGREGTQKKVGALGAELGFEAAYIPKRADGSEPISSKRIRQAILEGDLGRANALLGRPFAIEARVDEEKNLLFYKNVAFPLSGSYRVLLIQKNHKIESTAYFEERNCQIDAPLQTGDLLISFTI